MYGPLGITNFVGVAAAVGVARGRPTGVTTTANPTWGVDVGTAVGNGVGVTRAASLDPQAARRAHVRTAAAAGRRIRSVHVLIASALSVTRIYCWVGLG